MARLTTIASDLATAIGQITTIAGYGVTWGSVNQPDQALQTYPSAVISYKSETNTEASAIAPGSIYVQTEAQFEVLIRVALTSTASVPNYTVDAALDTALSALKRRFRKFFDGSAPGTSIGVDSYMEYTGYERVVEKSGDVFQPGDVQTRWTVKYMDRD